MTAYIESVGIISRCAQSMETVTELLNGSEAALSPMPIEFDSQIPPAKVRRNIRYKQYTYQDASFKEYGYGATQVTIK